MILNTNKYFFTKRMPKTYQQFELLGVVPCLLFSLSLLLHEDLTLSWSSVNNNYVQLELEKPNQFH